MANGNATIIVGSARLGSARQEHSAVFSACQVLFHTIPNHDRQINLFRLNFLPSPACPLSEEENSG